MAAPAIGTAGTAGAGTSTVSPTYPATVNANDIAILVVEHANQPISAAGIGDGSWSGVDRNGTELSAGAGTAGAVGSVGVQVFWRRCDGSEDGASVSVPDAGDHTIARIQTFTGCIKSGNPIGASATSATTSASTSYPIPGLTTPNNDNLVVGIAARGNDSGSTLAFSGQANADLTGVTRPNIEAGSTQGNGGGWGVVYGTKATAGSVGAWTLTGPSAEQALIAFSLLSLYVPLAAAAGAYSQTGSNADLLVGRRFYTPPSAIGATAIATFSYIGPPAAGYTLTASPGSYALTGAAASLKAARTLTASAGSHSLTGAAATLRRGYMMIGAAGSYALTGTAATFQLTYRLAANAGSYTLTGTAAALKAGRLLTAASGSYALSGTASGLYKGYKLAADAGAYTLTGTATSFLRGLTMAAGGGSYTLTGTAAAIKADRKLTATSGAYTLTGTAANLNYGAGVNHYTLTASAGSYTLTGTAAALLRQLRLAAGSGSYALTGTAASLLAARSLTCVSSAYALTGTAASLLRGYVLSAGSGTYNLSGADIATVRSYLLTASPGAYVITGTAAAMHRALASFSAARTVIVGAQDRSVVVEALPRMQVVDAQDRSVTVDAAVTRQITVDENVRVLDPGSFQRAT